MLAPQATATSVSPVRPSRSTQALSPAIARAPAGSRMLRVSWKTSLMAAQTASASTRTISSTSSRQMRNVSTPTRRTAVPSEKRPTSVSVDPVARLERAGHGVGVERLHADDADLRAQRLDVRGDPRDEAAPADRHEDRVDRAGVLAQDLHADRPLPGDHVAVVERVHEHEPARRRELVGARLRVRVGVAVEDHLDAVAAERPHRLDLHLRRRHRHDDHRPASEAGRRQRDALGVVAGRRRDHPARPLGRVEADHAVVGAAELEREDRLVVLALQEHRASRCAPRARGARSSSVSRATS